MDQRGCWNARKLPGEEGVSRGKAAGWDIMAERSLDGGHPDLRAPAPYDPDAKPTMLQRLKSGELGWKALAGIVAGLF